MSHQPGFQYILKFSTPVQSALLIALSLLATGKCFGIQLPYVPCQRNAYGNLQEVAMFTKGVDNRKSLKDAGAELGLSPEESQRIRVNTGKIVCPGTKYGNGVQASASLIGSGGHLITNAHVFQDDKTKKFREPLSQCYFENKDTPPSKSYLAISDSHEGLKIGVGYPQFQNADYAIANLATPIRNASPFPVNLNRRNKLLLGDKTIVVSNVMRLSQKLDPKEPIVQSCEPDVPRFGNPDAFDTKCDMFEGGS